MFKSSVTEATDMDDPSELAAAQCHSLKFKWLILLSSLTLQGLLSGRAGEQLISLVMPAPVLNEPRYPSYSDRT